jgi:hypothetical protein
MNDTLRAALAYLRAGLSLIPVRRGGSKAPDGRLLPREKLNPDTGRMEPTWDPYQERLPTEAEIRRWFAGDEPPGIGIVGGRVSGGLECLDFDGDADTIFPAWCELVEAEAPGLIERLNVVRTPGHGGAYHVRYRCPAITIPGNTDLAMDPARSARQGRKLIETRGEGGYALAPGSPGACHETGGTYEHHAGPKLSQVQTITPAERAILIRCARSFDRRQDSATAGGGSRPGEDFDRRGPGWAEILEPHGWRVARTAGTVTYWRRPGKDGPGWSATTGRCTSGGVELLRVFTSNAAPFEEGKAYGRFRAWALLAHGGDFAAAARELAGRGYGTAAGRGAGRADRNGNGPPHENGTAARSVRLEELLDASIGAARPAEWPAPPDAAAFHGLAGELVDRIDSQTEADRVAILAQFLVMFGNAIGRRAYYPVESDRHHLNLYCVLVGRTAKGRKGTSLGRVQALFRGVADEWLDTRIQGGLSSGEGLIWAVRDEIRRREPVKQRGRVVDYQEVTVDHGVEDKRLLVLEPEFASVLRTASRDGNTLSAVLRQAWDSGRLRSMTKNSPARATGAHISIIGHVTRQELVRLLTESDAANGFANRFLWLCVRRSKLLPEGGRPVELSDLRARLGRALEFARGADFLVRDDEAGQLWRSAYVELSREQPGLLGLITNRAEAQVLRLSCLYALLDESPYVRAPHLQAALALWDYCERSCRYVFSSSETGDADADEILGALRARAEAGQGGLSKSEIRAHVFNGHIRAAQLDRALAALVEHGLAAMEEIETGGRRMQLWFAQRQGCAKSAKSPPHATQEACLQ